MVRHIMVDLETMGTGRDAAIVALGAVAFDRIGITSEFYRAISLESSMSFGGSVDGATVMWWLNQSDAARAALTSKDSVDVFDAVTDFRDWLEGQAIWGKDAGTPDFLSNIRVWGNGADFDNVILAETFRMVVGVNPPWRHTQNRCFRTICASFDGNGCVIRSGTHHHALDDARHQANILLELHRRGIYTLE